VSPRRPAANATIPNSAPTPVAADPAPARPTSREFTLAPGTDLPLELLDALSSETAAAGTEVRARLRQAITVDGTTIIPNGATVTGSVTDVGRAGRVQGKSHLTMRFTEVSFSGQRESLRTDPITFEGEASKKEDVTKVGAGAGIGAVIGGILGGGKGAAQGAAIGGAAGGGAVLATRGKDVELASGAPVTVRLAAPTTITVQER
jgi:hypothetical protein